MTTTASIPQPVRAKDNSPSIYPWVGKRVWSESRQGRKKMFGSSAAFCRPSGAGEVLGRVYPAIDRWAIFGCPGGTNTGGGVKK